MLSDEEKKAIEWFKKADWFSARLYSPTILNLIEKQSKEIEELKIIADKYEDLKIFYEDNICELEKQQKEIEELKEKNKFLNWYFENQKENFIHKDKIKAKIEELQKDIQYSANPLSIDNSKFGIKVLQSLLEKE